MKQRTTLLILTLLLLSGCSLAAAVAAGSEPTTLQVHRVHLPPESTYAPFSPRIITNQQTVQQLYDTIQALPRFDKSGGGVIFCRFNTSLDYQLDFYQGHTLVQDVIFHPSGCSTVRLGKNDVRVPTQSFVQLFAQAIGVSEADLNPTPLFSCTPHSPCPSPTP